MAIVLVENKLKMPTADWLIFFSSTLAFRRSVEPENILNFVFAFECELELIFIYLKKIELNCVNINRKSKTWFGSFNLLIFATKNTYYSVY